MADERPKVNESPRVRIRAAVIQIIGGGEVLGVVEALRIDDTFAVINQLPAGAGGGDMLLNIMTAGFIAGPPWG